MPIFKSNGALVLFIHIPKTGGTSIERFFASKGVALAFWSRQLHADGGQGFPCSPQHFHQPILEALFPETFFDKKVAVVRHPVTRMVSEYRHRMGIRIRKGFSVIDFEGWLKQSFGKVEVDEYFKDNHFRPQVQFIDDHTTVFRLEDGLINPVRYIADALEMSVGENPKIPIKNSGVKLDVAVSARASSLIEEVYSDDMQSFGYSDFTLGVLRG